MLKLAILDCFRISVVPARQRCSRTIQAGQFLCIPGLLNTLSRYLIVNTMRLPVFWMFLNIWAPRRITYLCWRKNFGMRLAYDVSCGSCRNEYYPSRHFRNPQGNRASSCFVMEHTFQAFRSKRRDHRFRCGHYPPRRSISTTEPQQWYGIDGVMWILYRASGILIHPSTGGLVG